MAIQWSQHGDDVPKTGTAVPHADLCRVLQAMGTEQRYRPAYHLPQYRTTRLYALREPGRTGQQRGAGDGDGAAY